MNSAHRLASGERGIVRPDKSPAHPKSTRTKALRGEITNQPRSLVPLLAIMSAGHKIAKNLYRKTSKFTSWNRNHQPRYSTRVTTESSPEHDVQRFGETLEGAPAHWLMPPQSHPHSARPPRRKAYAGAKAGCTTSQQKTILVQSRLLLMKLGQPYTDRSLKVSKCASYEWA